ncbi:FadR/GntR family transcriptional regulator [Schaalia sp. 19OD2882]|uniref:FadR/GntR family transcriptional regulator n=1 Tax=Schaalia sp. 19OD2882 TaxID=2794089 RepID=UPI0020A6E4A8|nr:GntR family transcriptional regulator [Schaalia sp. 19OD2882]
MVNRSTATMDAIKSHILRNRLSTGDPLPTEAALGAEVGVSRSSVREALRKLEALDIVQVRQGAGSFVGGMSLEPMIQTLVLRASLASANREDFLQEVVDARRALDLGIASEIVAAHHDTPDPELDAIVEEMEKLARAGQRFMNEDISFHMRLLAPLDSHLARQLYSAFWFVHMSIVPELGEGVDEGLLRTANAHRAMLDTARSGDVEAYREAVREHYVPLAEILHH